MEEEDAEGAFLAQFRGLKTEDSDKANFEQTSFKGKRWCGFYKRYNHNEDVCYFKHGRNKPEFNNYRNKDTRSWSKTQEAGQNSVWTKTQQLQKQLQMVKNSFYLKLSSVEEATMLAQYEKEKLHHQKAVQTEDSNLRMLQPNKQRFMVLESKANNQQSCTYKEKVEKDLETKIKHVKY